MSAAPTGAGPLAVVFLDGDYGEPPFYQAWIEEAAFVLAADGGARFLLDLGVFPQAVVGDFDSLGGEDIERLRVAGVELVRHPIRKDATDGELAVSEALRRGAGEVVLAGGIGALDHTLGHIAILRSLAARGIAARLAAPQLTVRVLCAPAAVTLGAGAGARVSVVSLEDEAVVTLEGLDYALDHGVISAVGCLGLGNHVTGGEAARIVLHHGVIAVLVEDGRESFVAAAITGAGG